MRINGGEFLQVLLVLISFEVEYKREISFVQFTAIHNEFKLKLSSRI
jgi:hypothetical protein